MVDRLHGKLAHDVCNVKNYKKGAVDGRKNDMDAIVRDPTKVSSPQCTDWDDQVSGVCDEDPNYYGDMCEGGPTEKGGLDKNG